MKKFQSLMFQSCFRIFRSFRIFRLNPTRKNFVFSRPLKKGTVLFCALNWFSACSPLFKGSARRA